MIDDIARMLDEHHDKMMQVIGDRNTPIVELPQNFKDSIDVLIEHSESSKGVISVVVTSVVYKILHREQDIRNHQQSIQNGYSGRTFDSKNITPYLRRHKFPSMAESGWLTRSLEQKVPYNFEYTGAIKPQTLKDAFLRTIDNIEHSGKEKDIFDYLIQCLIIQRNKKKIDIATPQNLSIANIMVLLEHHFRYKYKAPGASRLPVLALYAVYQSLIKELKRFENKTLLPIGEHNSADTQSGRKGDIDIFDNEENPFEAVEVKFDIPVNRNIVDIAKEKIQTCRIKRYYILSTVSPVPADMDYIEEEIRQIKNVHGCQLVVNGVFQTIKYYLRLLDDTKEFINNYAHLLAEDRTIKFEHKEAWNNIISNTKI